MVKGREIKSKDDTLQGLLGTGIDDLAKYRIVQHLQESDRPLDAPSIAASLGLQPRELVVDALETLACNGILVREQADPALYTLSAQPTLRRALQRFFCPMAPQDMSHIFQALAAASLAKAKARAKGTGGG